MYTDSSRLDWSRIDSSRIDSSKLDSSRLDSSRLDSSWLDSSWLDSSRLDMTYLFGNNSKICRSTSKNFTDPYSTHRHLSFELCMSSVRWFWWWWWRWRIPIPRVLRCCTKNCRFILNKDFSFIRIQKD